MKSLHSCIVVLVAALAIGAHASRLDAATYYVDSAGGNDNNAGTSMTTAWKTLAKVNATTFQPGDVILFKAGGIWSGTTQLHPLGSGVSGRPIVIDRYGDGPKPVIDAGSATGFGAVYLVNQQYWEINNLDITSDAPSDGDRRGVHILVTAAGLYQHIYIRNNDIHDIRGKVGATDGDLSAKRTGGIIVEATSTSARYHDILIEGNTIDTVVNQGIVACVNGNGASSLNNYYPGTSAWNNVKCTSVVIRGNVISNVYKNAMIIRNLDETGLVEHNVCHDTATGTTGNTIFTSSARGTVFQFNEGYANRAGDHDGSLYDADLRSPSIVFQYSYSHDNSHGLFWTYPNSSSEPNSNVVVRYNISQNDQGDIFAFSGSSATNSSTYIYNNTIYISASNPAPANPPQKIFEDRQSGHTYYVWNNIFYVLNPTATYSFRTSTRTFDYNVFYGSHPSTEPADAHKLTSDPQFVQPGSGGLGIGSVDGYQLLSGSPAIDSGRTVASNGGRDYFGNPVPSGNGTDRGAHEYGGPCAQPVITAQPASQTACEGSPAVFSVTATGTSLAYQWQLSTGGGAFDNVAGATSSTYATPGTKESDVGQQYRVVVSNTCGSVTSQEATLSGVNARPRGFVSGSTMICSGTGATIEALLYGLSPWNARWSDGATQTGVSTSPLLRTASPTATTTYTLTGLSDATMCAAQPVDLDGSAVITVNTKPAVTVSPQSQTVVVGATATFTANASGTVPLAYQWRKAGVNIPSATTASLVLASVGTADSGTYDAVVSNGCGTTASNAATLAVTPAAAAGVVVIEEIYPGGGKSGASYQNDFVVLRNIGGSTVSLNGWSLQHYKAGVWQKPFALPNVSLPAGGYFLIKAYNDGTSSGSALPTADATTPQSSAWNFNTSGANAIALVKNKTRLTGCGGASLADLVGFNTTAGNCYEGTGTAPAGSATTSLQRRQMGYQDSGDNAADFTLATPTPR